MPSRQPPTACPVCAGPVSVDRFGVAACRTNAGHLLRPWVGESRTVHGSHPRRYYGAAVLQHQGWVYSEACRHEHADQARALACADRIARKNNRAAGLPLPTWRAPSRRTRL